jgi:hypothetical protein
MAGTLTDVWRVIKPAQSKSSYVSSDPEAAKFYSNFSWYTKVMKGATSRFSKYTQYRNMDGDVFVARAMDTVAEEMSQFNSRTRLPFEIDYQNENNEEVPDNITMTVRAALRHWSEIQDFNTILFDICRETIKYGDCFFRKTSDFKRWQYLNPADVVGVSIDDEGKIQHYHVRTGEKNKSGAFGDTTMMPAAGVIHFSLSSMMGENGPFGESVLFPVIKAYRHLSLLEDSVIIYRIVRAPERRVFFVDVGNMPPQRAKAYLEALKMELKQKRIPNETGGTDKIDSVYNPMCLTLDTRIPLLDGRTLPLNQLIEEHEAGKQNWAYSTDPTSGAIVPGLISWAGVTRRNAEIARVTLDNGKTITCTPDHQFPTLNRGFVEARELQPTDSLISYETDQKSLSRDPNRSYTRVFDHSTNEFVMVHRLVAEYFRGLNKHQEFTFSPEYEGMPKADVHHQNYDRYDNSPQNLVWMNHRDHFLYHSQVKKEWWEQLKTEERDRITNEISSSLKAYYTELSPEQREELSVASSIKFKKMIKQMKTDEPAKYARWRETLGAVRSARAAEDEFFKEQLCKNLTSFGGTQPIQVSRNTLGQLITIIKREGKNRNTVIDAANRDPLFLEMLATDNRAVVSKKITTNKFAGKLSDKGLTCIYKTYGYKNWKHLASSVEQYNHRVKSVELLNERVDTGCITIDGDHKYHDHHTFALEAGVFTKNSMTEDYFFAQPANGRGSRVETLSGGENLGEIADLNYFQTKFLQGLRIPASYMRGGTDGGAQVNDGKVGIAYIEELRFANYVARLQNKLNDTFDHHFKVFLNSAGINIDKHLFKLKLVDPQNFVKYQDAELDEKLLGNYGNVKDDKTISVRFRHMRFLGLSEDEVQENEVMRKQEEGIPEGGIDSRLTELRMLYDWNWLEHRPEPKVDESWDDHTETSKNPDEEEPEEEDDKDKGEGDQEDEGDSEKGPTAAEGDAKPEEKSDDSGGGDSKGDEGGGEPAKPSDADK